MAPATDVCTSAASNRTNALNILGFAPCAAGGVQRATPHLTMVWQLSVAGGPFAIRPPDIQIVEAAAMATSGSRSLRLKQRRIEKAAFQAER